MLSICASFGMTDHSNQEESKRLQHYQAKRLKHYHNTKRSLHKLIKQNMHFIESNCDTDSDAIECDEAWDRVYMYSKAVKDARRVNTIRK